MARLGTWAQALYDAPATRPGDAAERTADRGSPGRAAAGPAPAIGTPPWGAGRPLHESERLWQERRLGTGLSEVRVHEGPEAARWAGALGARAFSVGRDVVLGAGEYAPGTESGRSLLTHELSHVVMARGRPPLLARVTLTQADFDALADSLHAAITTKTADEELIYVALQKLERDKTAISSLETAYKTKHKTDLPTALQGRLTGTSLSLALGLLGKPGGTAIGAAPSGAAGHDTLAKAVNAALTAKTIDPQPVYAALLPLARDPALTGALKGAYKTLFSTDLDADIAATLSGADRSYALYLLNAPQAATAHSPSNIPTKPGFGAPPKTAPPAVAGGTVSAGTGVPYITAKGNQWQFSFGVGYSGALSADTRWLQFIARRINVTKGGKTTALSETIKSGIKIYPSTTDWAKPNWMVDSNTPTSPFFDETHSGETFRDASSVSIYDAPQPKPTEKIVEREFAAGATAVVSCARFEIYLVRDFSAIYRVEVEVLWSYTAPGAYTTARNVLSTGTVSGLPSAQQAALVNRYPSYSYVR